LKIVARGNEVKVLGDEAEINNFTSRFSKIVEHVERQQTLSSNELERLLDAKITVESPIENSSNQGGGNEAIVFGHNGIVVKARTANQRRMVEGINKNDILFAIGPAGTGKTYTAVALAVRALKNKEIKRIILTRPAVEAGENLGFLPGDLKEKIDPYLRPLYDALDDMIPPEKLKVYLENRTIEVAPLAFMRGRTLDNCFVILDEAQNTTDMQIKMFLTRMGPNAKFIVTGDVTQIDLPKKQQSGLQTALRILTDIKGIDIIYLNGDDVVRHKLVKQILKAYGDIQ
jgi:phosphate starvation-inducible PhoH-like protein